MGLADRIKRTADRLSHTSVRGSSEAKIVGGKVYGGAKAVYSGAKAAKNKVGDIQADHREKKETKKLAKEIKQLDDFRTESERDQRAADYVYGRKMTPSERKSFAKYKKAQSQPPKRDIFTGRDPPRRTVGRKVRSVQREAVRDARRYDVNDAVRSSPFGGGGSVFGGSKTASRKQRHNDIKW